MASVQVSDMNDDWAPYRILQVFEGRLDEKYTEPYATHSQIDAVSACVLGRCCNMLLEVEKGSHGNPRLSNSFEPAYKRCYVHEYVQ